MTPAALRAALRLYLVLDPDVVSGDPLVALRAAIAGGVTMVQLRSKGRSDRETLALGRPIAEACREAGIPFLVNDRLDIALALAADGIHLGVDDLPLEDARRLAGPDFLIGFSPDADDEARSAADRGADYLGIGPIFGTATKADAGAALGATEFRRRRKLTGLPVVGIGGISATNASEAIAAGADGVAVVSAILRAPDPKAATAAIAAAVNTSFRS